MHESSKLSIIISAKEKKRGLTGGRVVSEETTSGVVRVNKR